MNTFDISLESTSYKNVLESIKEQASSLRFVHNPNTWRLSALTLALHIHDSIFIFEDVKERWKEHLPFSEAWDVDFGYWKKELWNSVYNIESFKIESGKFEKLCDTDYKIFMGKVSAYFKGEIPMNDVLSFLEGKNTELSAVVVEMGKALTSLLTEIDEIAVTAFDEQYIELYEQLMGTYMHENASIPYPIDMENGMITFERWIASKSEKQRIKHIAEKLNAINTSVLNVKFWAETWSDNVDIENKEIDKEGIGRAIFIRRCDIIGNNRYTCSSSMYKLFSSLALCNHLWEYLATHSKSKMSFGDLSDSRKEILTNIESLVDNGNWEDPASNDNIKAFLRQVLGIGTQMLTPEEEIMSNILWDLFETGQGDRKRITFQNLIGYFAHYGYLPSNMGAEKLNKAFFANKAKIYQNINKGTPGNDNMPPRFKQILPLLDKYRPK